MQHHGPELFNKDGAFAGNDGATKPTKQDADSTNYQNVFAAKVRLLWTKAPAPDYFSDCTYFYLNELWSGLVRPLRNPA